MAASAMIPGRTKAHCRLGRTRAVVFWALGVWLSILSACAGDGPADGAAPPATSTTSMTSISGAAVAGADEGVDYAAGQERYVAVIAAREAVDVATRHEGTLTEVLVRPGSPVAKDQVLARLDDAPMRESLALARAERASAQATLAQHQVTIEEAQSKLDTERTLAAQGIGARQALDDARFALEKALSARDIAQTELVQQQARIAILVRQLEEAQVKAPFAGIVSLRYADPGALLDQGAAVVRLIRADALWVKFAVPPEHAAAFAVGDAVTAELVSPAVSLSATIRTISPELDPAARMIFMEAELTVPEQWRGKLRAGLPAWVRRIP